MSAPAPARTTGWPSVPKVLVAALGEAFPDARVATRFPSNLQSLAAAGTGIVRVIRIGGANDRVTDVARVAIDVVHGSEGHAEDLAEDIRTWLVDPSRTIWGAGAMLDRVTCEVAPHELPYTDPTVSQFSMSFAVSSRRMETR